MKKHAVELKSWARVGLLAVSVSMTAACAGSQPMPDNSALEACEADRARAQAELASLREQNEELSGLMKERDALYEELRSALEELIAKGRIQIQFRKGLMVLVMPSEVLFDSGSAEVHKEGRETLAQVAKALAPVKDRRILVAGHTDNVPVNSASGLSDNWELSNRRALRVLRILVKEGASPGMLGTAGFGQHDPVVENSSDANKKRNRRVELILIPDLENVLQRSR